MCPLSAFAPWNVSRNRILISDNPSGIVSVDTTRLDCIEMPHAVCRRSLPNHSARAIPIRVLPIPSVSPRSWENSLV